MHSLLITALVVSLLSFPLAADPDDRETLLDNATATTSLPRSELSAGPAEEGVAHPEVSERTVRAIREVPLGAAAPQARSTLTPPAPHLVPGGYHLPAAEGVTWLVGGTVSVPGTHRYSSAQQRRRLIISAWPTRPETTELVGQTSWVLSAEPFAPTVPAPQVAFTWNAREEIGRGWTGRVIAAGDFDSNGSPDLFRVDGAGYLWLYRTQGEGRFITPTRYGRGWKGFTLLASGADFDGDSANDLLGVDATGRLYLYRGDGHGGILPGRRAFGLGWRGFRMITLAPATSRHAPRLIAVGKDNRMYVYTGDGSGSFRPGRTPLGYGWGAIREVFATADWTHDGVSDLIAHDRSGVLRIYPGNAAGLWAGHRVIGRGWTSQRGISVFAGGDVNELWSVDHGNRLWRYTNRQVGHVPAQVSSTGFQRSGFRLSDTFTYPLASGRILTSAWPLDGAGVPIVTLAGINGGQRLYHPVAYARFALDSAENAIVATNDDQRRSFLSRSSATAKALLAGAHRRGDELWFPYGFPYRVLGEDSYRLAVPWYSGMSQGLALAAFVRLSQLTGDIAWRQAADQVLATFYATGVGTPRMSEIDGEGRLWFEEYPATASPTQVLNGHLFAVEGLQYYWLDTHCEGVNTLVDGAMTTVVRQAADFRVPGQPSAYCASLLCWSRRHRPLGYHRIVYNQLHTIGAALQAEPVEELARTLRSDAP